MFIYGGAGFLKQFRHLFNGYPNGLILQTNFKLRLPVFGLVEEDGGVGGGSVGKSSL